MPLVEFTALLVLATAMSFTPGPNTTLSTVLAANRGLAGAMRFVLSVPVGWCPLLRHGLTQGRRLLGFSRAMATVLVTIALSLWMGAM